MAVNFLTPICPYIKYLFLTLNLANFADKSDRYLNSRRSLLLPLTPLC
ncbi:MAG: hypothetical protein KME25_01800 [Symplocastrum torsivum CPER-KK1]|uniref:Uncharacterized protein n=1 Tax=Symplocastrum torsivum CPER-KK1 TaxID=450513 RepID=A0A951PII4_9CYAN|nr:hypothetical protein [Symplocastrum torsivum CPER-KK1]